MDGRAPALAGLLVLALAILAQLILSPMWRPAVLDRLLLVDAWLPPVQRAAQAFDIVVVDIDRASLDAVGPWPWPRTTMASLVEKAAESSPAAIGIDILFADADQRSPAALARQLAQITGRMDLDELAAGLPDGDVLLSDAIAAAPAILGFVLDPDGRSSLPGAAFLTEGRPVLDGLWRGTGAIGPTPVLMDVAYGLGALSLPGDSDGVVRQVPMLVAAGAVVLPGLALETLRLAFGPHVYRLEASADGTSILEVGARRLPLPPGGLFRMLPEPGGSQHIRTIPAIDVMAGKADGLQGSIVLIGGSAPELGGLRATPFDPLIPSVQIQAHAIAQMMGGRVVVDAPSYPWVEQVAVLVLGGLAIVLALRMGPLAGLAGVAVACLAWSGGALILLHQTDRLIDPAGPVAAAAMVFAAAAFTSFVTTRTREQRLRDSFGQRLHPAIVDRLARRPDRLKLAGERRVVTVLVTDLEGFTGLTHRVDPPTLIGLLDRYLEGICRIVIEHGGMVDKLVGDAVHSIFNAPADVPDHARRALDAAQAILRWTEEFRREPGAAAGDLGRTRIGMETGDVIVGDVGMGTRLDYTAYGDAVNLAVRLEGLNKEFGTSIIVGPTAAAAVDKWRLQPLGPHPVRGHDQPVALFTVAATAEPLAPGPLCPDQRAV